MSTFNKLASLKRGRASLADCLIKAEMKTIRQGTNSTFFLVHINEIVAKSACLEQLNRELEVGNAKKVIMNDDKEQEQDAPMKTEKIGKSVPKPKR